MSHNHNPSPSNTDNILVDAVDIVLKLESIINDNKIQLEPQLQHKLKVFKQETMDLMKSMDMNLNHKKGLQAHLNVAKPRTKSSQLLKSKSMNAVFDDNDSKEEPPTPSDPFTTTLTSVVIEINETLKPIDVSNVHRLFSEENEFNESSILQIEPDVFCDKAKRYHIEAFQAKRILKQLQSTYPKYSILITKDPSETSSSRIIDKLRPRIMRTQSLNALQGLGGEANPRWNKRQLLKDKDKLDGIMSQRNKPFMKPRFLKTKSMNALQDRYDIDVVSIEQLKKDVSTLQVPQVQTPQVTASQNILSEYETFFNRLREKKSNSDARRDKLELCLLKAHKMKRLADCTNDVERQLLMKQKVELCEYICDFHQKWEEKGSIRIKNKKDLLCEIIHCMTQHKWNNEQLLDQCFKTISKNLFRSLPEPNENEDVYDTAWDHIQSVHELTYHVVNNSNISKKNMLMHLQPPFLQNMIRLFGSPDVREPEYAKLVIHKIYAKFMNLRGIIRQYFGDFCLSYIYLSTYQDVGSWYGIAEILQILAAVFQGLNVPVKSAHLSFVRNVIVPLHKAFHLDEFHSDLVCCSITLIVKEPELAAVILGGLIKFWPSQNHAKQRLFITEMVAILKVCENHPNMNLSDPVFVNMSGAVLNKFVECIGSPHHEVVAHAFMAWNDITIKKMVMQMDKDKITVDLNKMLEESEQSDWSSDVREMREMTLEQLKLMTSSQSTSAAQDFSDDDFDVDDNEDVNHDDDKKDNDDGTAPTKD